jgi:SAM-dependent methyltransferase
MSKPMEFLHLLLGKSSVYSLGMWALGADHARRVHISKYIQPKVGERILDVGCGPADVLEYLPSVSVTGVDFEPAGKMVTYDGCRIPNQHPFDRWMLDNDRGKFVRTRDAYAELASSVFPSVEINLHSNLLRIPYTHAIMTLSLVPNLTMALHHSALLNDFSKP